jgi:uncharacterized membrane protein YhfC
MKKIWRLTAFCIFFALSLTFPVTASITNISVTTIRYIDILIALILVALALIIHVKRSPHKQKGSRKFIINLYKALLSIPIVLLMLFLLNLSIKWDVLLIGLAWRFWLLSLILEDLVHIYLAESRSPVVVKR